MATKRFKKKLSHSFRIKALNLVILFYKEITDIDIIGNY